MDKSLEVWKSAIEAQNVSLVRKIIQENPQLVERINDQLFDFDRSAIHCCRENLELVDLLLENGADINLKTGWWAGGFGILEGISPNAAKPLIDRGAKVDIWAAVCLNDLEAVRHQLSKDPDLISAPGGDGKHPIHDAHDVAMIELLIERGANVLAKCVDHESLPIHYQVTNRPVVDKYLAVGIEPDVFMAAYWGEDDWLDSSLGSDPNCCDCRLGFGKWSNNSGGHIYNWTIGHDLTPQQVARNQNHSSMLARLLDKAAPNRKLMDAIWEEDQRRVDQVLEQFPSVLDQLTSDDRKTLPRAAWWYRPKAVEIMLKLGWNPQVIGAHESTPLDRAAFHGYADIVKMCLQHDPDPPLQRLNEFGGTPLGACLHGFQHGWKTGHPQDHVATVKLLVEAGANVTRSHLGSGNEQIDAIIQENLLY